MSNRKNSNPFGSQINPLLPTDPPKVGDFWLDGSMVIKPAGTAFLAHNENHPSVMLILLADGPANDAAARDRFAGEINKMHIDTVIARGGQSQNEGRLAAKFVPEDDDPVGPADAPLAPWVALAYDGSPGAIAEANRILDSVSLTGVVQKGSPAGPDFRIHWGENRRTGLWRLWPLPWPGRTDRTGWVPKFVAWVLMIVLALLGLLLAVLLFQRPDPPPVPEQQQTTEITVTPGTEMPSEPSQGSEDSPTTPTTKPLDSSPTDSSPGPSRSKNKRL